MIVRRCHLLSGESQVRLPEHTLVHAKHTPVHSEYTQLIKLVNKVTMIIAREVLHKTAYAVEALKKLSSSSNHNPSIWRLQWCIPMVYPQFYVVNDTLRSYAKFWRGFAKLIRVDSRMFHSGNDLQLRLAIKSLQSDLQSVYKSCLCHRKC